MLSEKIEAIFPLLSRRVGHLGGFFSRREGKHTVYVLNYRMLIMDIPIIDTLVSKSVSNFDIRDAKIHF